VAASHVTAIAGLIAASGAIWLAVLNRKLVLTGQEQARLAQEQLVSQQRPVLVPVGEPIFQEAHDNWLKWEESMQPLGIRNLGAGTAYTIAGVLYGCASYLHDDQ
jgi:hypothetical protein